MGTAPRLPGGGAGTITRKAKRISMSGSYSGGGSITVSVSDILSELSDSQAQKLTTSNFLVGLDDAEIDHDSSRTSVVQRVTVSYYSPSERTVSLYYATSYNSSTISANLYVFYAE